MQQIHEEETLSQHPTGTVVVVERVETDKPGEYKYRVVEDLQAAASIESLREIKNVLHW